MKWIRIPLLNNQDFNGIRKGPRVFWPSAQLKWSKRNLGSSQLQPGMVHIKNSPWSSWAPPELVIVKPHGGWVPWAILSLEANTQPTWGKFGKIMDSKVPLETGDTLVSGRVSSLNWTMAECICRCRLDFDVSSCTSLQVSREGISGLFGLCRTM